MQFQYRLSKVSSFSQQTEEIFCKIFNSMKENFVHNFMHDLDNMQS